MNARAYEQLAVEEGDIDTPDGFIEEIEALFQHEVIMPGEERFMIGERTREGLLVAMEHGIRDKSVLRVNARMWQRIEDLYGDEAQFVFYPRPLDEDGIEKGSQIDLSNGSPLLLPDGWEQFSFIGRKHHIAEQVERNAFVRADTSTPAGEFQGYAETFLANYEELKEQMAREVEELGLLDILEDNALAIETSHGQDITPALAPHLLAAVLEGEPYGVESRHNMTMLMGLRAVSGHRAGEVPRKDMLPFVNNYALILPPTGNAKVPGAKLLTRQIRNAGSEAWRARQEQPGQITIKNSIGAVDQFDGQPATKPKRAAIMAAAPSENKVVMTVSIAEQDPSKIMGMDVRLHFHDPAKSPTQQGSEVLFDHLYGQSLQQARRRQQVAIARAA